MNVESKVIKPVFDLSGIVDNLSSVVDNENITPWPDVPFGVPNKFLRNTLFSVQRERKDELEQFCILKNEDIEIQFSGYLLNQDDSIVWQSILKAVKNSQSSLGSAVTIQKGDVLKALNKTDGGDNYRWLSACLRRLSKSGITIITKTKETSSQLIIGYSIEKNSPYFKAGISGFLSPLLSEDLTDIDIYRKVNLKNQLSRWLHDFYSSHTSPIPYKLDRLRELCRSNMNAAKFKMAIKKSVEDLKTCEPPLFTKDTFIDLKENVLYAFKETNSPGIPPVRKKMEKIEQNKNESFELMIL